jgi:enterochelin esterase-like enzyme
MNKLTTYLGLAIIVATAAPISLLAAGQPGADSPYKRDPNTPGAPALTPVVPNADELAQINAALKKAVSGDPAAKAAFDQHPNFNPLTVTAANPPPNVDGNFIIGPIYLPAPENVANANVPKGKVNRFTMDSKDSAFYPGIGRDTYGTPDPNNPKTMLVPTSHPVPYTRQVTVYIPAQYVPGTYLPFIVTADAMTGSLPTVLDNLIAQHRVPVMAAIMIAHGGRPSSDAQGEERGLEYDTMSGKYAEFVEAEVLPQVEKLYNVKLTKDPEGRATMGGSSGGSCALIMAWYHPDLYHRVLTYSGTYVNQQWPFNPETPDGAWDFHEHLIPESPVKPIRIWLEVGDTDLFNPNAMRDGMHDWVVANQHMANVLHAKGYHYQYVFAQNAGHVDGNVVAQTLPEALEWLWQGYPKDAPPQK